MTTQQAPAYQSLAYFALRAVDMSDTAIAYAISEIDDMLSGTYRDTDPARHPYAAKLWAEFDAYTSERAKRAKRAGVLVPTWQANALTYDRPANAW